MMPSSIEDKLHKTLVKTTGLQEPNGGVLTIFFGDFTQQTPIDRNDPHPVSCN